MHEGAVAGPEHDRCGQLQEPHREHVRSLTGLREAEERRQARRVVGTDEEDAQGACYLDFSSG